MSLTPHLERLIVRDNQRRLQDERIKRGRSATRAEDSNELQAVGEYHAYCVVCGGSLGFSESADAWIHLGGPCEDGPWLNEAEDPSPDEISEAIDDHLNTLADEPRDRGAMKPQGGETIKIRMEISASASQDAVADVPLNIWEMEDHREREAAMCRHMSVFGEWSEWDHDALEVESMEVVE